MRREGAKSAKEDAKNISASSIMPVFFSSTFEMSSSRLPSRLRVALNFPQSIPRRPTRTLRRMTRYVLDTYHELAPHDRQEWLLTNGLGGFASSTVVGMNIRRYHGLLVAATVPPVGRIMTVNRLAEILTFDDSPDETIELSVNQFRGAVHPRGDQYLEQFELADTARWTYDIEGVRIVKEVQAVWLQNATAVRYIIDSGDRPFKLAVKPFTSMRDFHGLRHRDGADIQSEPAFGGVTVRDGDHHVSITADNGVFHSDPDWWFGHVYPIETERGQDDSEDLFTPGQFVITGTGRAVMTIWMSVGSEPAGDFEVERDRRRSAITAARTDPENVATGAPFPDRTDTESIARLKRAAQDFVVRRNSPDGKDGTSIIAGYPWFADWGRDTMISLPGLLLVPGRFHQSRQVLCVFAQYVDRGMIPNRFGDYTNEPEYNTVDASLWFIHAVSEYLRLSHDKKTFTEVLHPACRKIIDGYRAGTRYHIAMDPADGLITQGDADTQLTWMDAKCGNIAFTPRQGKPVEINALWYHALVLMGETDLAAKVAASFRKAFWISPFRGLADVVDGDRKDYKVRPNQIFAVSLPNSPLSFEQQMAVVEVVRRELLTPVGLRTLAKSDPGYRGTYSGPQFDRDGAYHNGTVWPWLIGAFLEAYLKVNARSSASLDQARAWLSPLITHMTDTAAIGQISEIFEGDEPHRPVGCPAQAWSIAEVLRLAVDLGV
jgi:predicted glycogen debranching enzyme